ncbi:MAG: hypothetical protein AAB618_03620 [Patescibacteria group bacterium]
MLYNQNELPKFMQTAGKITILTAFAGVAVFLMAFLFDAGTQQLSRVSAQTATTTLTVLNTPPTFQLAAYEVTESSTSTPTNSASAIQWRAIGSDSNNAPYFLLVCSTSTAPTANAAAGPGSLGTAPPTCVSGTQWGVSAAASSSVAATVSTTTLETGLFAGGSYSGEKHNWFAWVCDDDPTNPRCSLAYSQGYSATNSSPYHINKRPVLTNAYNNGPVNPGATLSFLSTSTDPNTIGGEDNIYIVVCDANNYNTTTNTCNAGFLASTTVGVTANATAAYILASIVRDNTYSAFTFLVDQHGHEASANPIQNNFVVNNVAPTLLSGDITLNNASNITLTIPADETTGFSLDFTISDANSCVNTTGVPGSEITGYRVALHRSSIATTTCDSTVGSYNPNNCYASQLASSVWNLSCTASSTTCTGASDDDILYECTFPLWFVADPTDVGTPWAAENWRASVAGIDDDSAVGNLVTSSIGQELISFVALDLITASIPYGGLEPGDDTGTLSATTTILAVGNTALDQESIGESMCTTFAVGNECAPSATSTVPEDQQEFSTTSLSYGSVQALTLSSTTPQELELDVTKTTSTSTPSQGITYWGIAVPGTISLAGSYEGLNTFTAAISEVGEGW